MGGTQGGQWCASVICSVEDMAENITWVLGQEFSPQVSEWLHKMRF